MLHIFENKRINQFIQTHDLYKFHGMEEKYLNITFRYHGKIWNGAIPILSEKYHGISIPLTIEDVSAWVIKCYEELNPGKNIVWQNAQRQFWDHKRAFDSKAVFDVLNGNDDLTIWQCRKCGPVPKSNAQSGARIKKLREFGFFIATKKIPCATCRENTFYDLLIRLPRQATGNVKRSSISKALARQIKEVLPPKDVCFDKTHTTKELVIDHKFPSSRWVQGESINKTNMSADEIKHKFQLLTNQTNLQKARYCDRCVATGQRGDFFGIVWYYKGDEQWRGSSKADEKGCEGCCWYDLEKWKTEFNKALESLKIKHR